MEANVVSIEGEIVRDCYNMVAQISMRIVNQAGVYGFQLMSMPDPNVRDLSKLLHVLILPTLAHLEEIGAEDPEDAIRICTMNKAIQQVRAITVALDEGDEVEFTAAVNALKQEPFLG